MHACVSGSLLFTYSRLEMRHSNLVSKCSFAHALFSIFVVSTDDMFSSLFAETLRYSVYASIAILSELPTIIPLYLRGSRIPTNKMSKRLARWDHKAGLPLFSSHR
jgi:hypothetical protein